jgi:hypothetical protein
MRGLVGKELIEEMDELIDLLLRTQVTAVIEAAKGGVVV